MKCRPEGFNHCDQILRVDVENDLDSVISGHIHEGHYRVVLECLKVSVLPRPRNLASVVGLHYLAKDAATAQQCDPVRVAGWNRASEYAC